MKTYHSTRSASTYVDAQQAVLQGIAPDGGLYVSDALGTYTLDCSRLASYSYQDLAQEILTALLPGFSAQELANTVQTSYGENFSSPQITPIAELPASSAAGIPTFALELFCGPTAAFKDLALQALPHLMTCAAQGQHIHIVCATSGDTGKAALAGFAAAPNCSVTVFYPQGKVSRIQELQMLTQAGSGATVCSVAGNFDDAQTAVKQIFGDADLARRLSQNGVALSSANSINVGRLAPQVAYYFACYAQLIRAGIVQPGDAVEFCVPTGNFGDILAGYYAKQMGLPISQLIVASDRNKVLYDFMTSGTYNRKRPFFTTSSPSMDILVSSNLERLLYYASQGDCELVTRLMSELEAGAYTAPASVMRTINQDFACAWADEDEVAAAIRHCWEHNHYLIDPHTACGYHALNTVAPAQNTRARVVLATASPFKFPRSVCAALGIAVGEDDFSALDCLEQHCQLCAPPSLSQLKQLPILHNAHVEISQMSAFVEHAATQELSR